MMSGLDRDFPLLLYFALDADEGEICFFAEPPPGDWFKAVVKDASTTARLKAFVYIERNFSETNFLHCEYGGDRP